MVFLGCGTKADFFVPKNMTERSIRKTMTKNTADAVFLRLRRIGRKFFIEVGFCPVTRGI